MNVKEARRRIQAVSLFLNLQTLAKNAKHYTPVDDNKQPVSEEMRRLEFYVREIDRIGARKIMRRMLNEIRVDKYEKKED